MSTRKYRFLTLSVVSAIASAAVLLGFAQNASAGAAPTTGQVCFRGRTLTVPTYVIPSYIAAGATAGACNLSGGM